MKSDSACHEIIVVGGGPAGLAAALYLGRYRRQPLVIDSGESRARWIPTSHNIPGFPAGIGGGAFLERLRAQALEYGAQIRAGSILSIKRLPRGFLLDLGNAQLQASFVLLATGVADHLPPLRGAEPALLRSLLRICPICDGLEAEDKRIAVLGNGEKAEREAEFLRTYSAEVSYIRLRHDDFPAVSRPVQEGGVEVIDARLEQLEIEQSALRLRLPAGGYRTFDVFYSALGCTARTALAQELGAARDDNGALLVDDHQRTSVEGLYAAGDVVRGLNQVVVAASEAAIAATDIHNRLRAQGSLVAPRINALRPRSRCPALPA
jgi:thioredoxin reductase (NADPH)